MRAHFVESVLNTLVQGAIIDPSSAVLAVCAGTAERDLFVKLGFSNVVITNLDDRMRKDQFAPYDWEYQDAQALTYKDDTFDVAFVADGLHHCQSPHRALLEMYRVARRGIIAVESRDGLLMRLANRMGLSPEYEIEAVVGNDFAYGGLNNTPIPNYIYRWTEAEFKKVIKAFNPTGRHQYRFFYGLSLPYETAEYKIGRGKLWAIRLAGPFIKLFTTLFKKQCNSFAMVALKPAMPDDAWPWLTVEGTSTKFNADYARKHYLKPTKKQS